MYFHYTVIIATLTYQYCSYLYYIKIHLRTYIWWYFQLTYDDFVTFIRFYCKLSQNFADITNIESVHLWYFLAQKFSGRQGNPLSSIFDHQWVPKPSSSYQNKRPLKYRAPSRVNWSLWGRSWLRIKLTRLR